MITQEGVSTSAMSPTGPERMDEGNQTDEIAIYEAENGIFEVRVQVQEGSVWLTQRQMAGLFDTSTDNISLHLKNIFADGEMTDDVMAALNGLKAELIARGYAGSREPLSAHVAIAHGPGGW